MKKPVIFLACAAAFVFIISCAGLKPIPNENRSSAVEGGTNVTSLLRPETPADGQGSAAALPVPKPGLTPGEIRLKLAEHAARFLASFKSWLRHGAFVKNNPTRTDPAARDVKNTPATANPRPSNPNRTTDVRPVVDSSRSADTSPSNGGRTILARAGDDVEISFAESGWLLLEKPPADSGLKYLDRDTSGNKTLFRFHGEKTGSYLLPFQYQDQTKGAMKRQAIEIKVVSQQEFDTTMGARGSDSDKEAKAKRRAYAAKLLDLGNYDEALREFLASAGEGDPALNHLIAALALRQKDYPNAILFWKKNLDQKGELHDKAVLGLVRASAALNDRNGLLALARPVLAIQGQPLEDELGLLIRFFSNLKDEALEFDLLREYVKRFPDGLRLAEVYFLLGQMYEFSQTFLDFKLSRDCYQVVVKAFPESPYFAPAKVRIEFINRHYFRVQ